MTLTQITLFFSAIIGVIALAMMIHSWIDKGRIKKNFLRLASEISGKVRQDNPLVYPCFNGEIDGRKFDLFFQVVKAGRHHILYVIYSLQSEITCDLLLLKSAYFKPIQDETEFRGKAGEILPELDPRYQIRSKDPEAAKQIFEQGALGGRLETLEEFTSLQLGPDAVVAGKPYDGPFDTEPARIRRIVGAIKELAEAIEQCAILT